MAFPISNSLDRAESIVIRNKGVNVPIKVTDFNTGTTLFQVSTAGAVTSTGSQTLTGDQTITGTLTDNKTVGTAALSTVRSVVGSITANFAGTLTSGNIVGVRGVATIAAGTTAGSGTFIYGAQGKVILAGTEAGGDVTGVIGQLDLSAGTNTSGIVSAGWFDLGATASGTMNETYLLRVTNTTAATIESFVHMYGKCGAVFSVENNGSACIDATAHGSTADGRLAILVNGATRYLHVFSD